MMTRLPVRHFWVFPTKYSRQWVKPKLSSKDERLWSKITIGNSWSTQIPHKYSYVELIQVDQKLLYLQRSMFSPEKQTRLVLIRERLWISTFPSQESWTHISLNTESNTADYVVPDTSWGFLCKHKNSTNIPPAWHNLNGIFFSPVYRSNPYIYLPIVENTAETYSK